VGGKRWTPEEINILRELYSVAPKEEILKALPRRSWNAIQLKAERMGLRRVGFIPREQPELAYILGLIMGDGTVYCYEKKDDCSICLINTNKLIVDEYIRACEKLGFHVGVVTLKPKPPGKKQLYRACFRSKAFAEWYQNIDIKYLEHFLREDELFNAFLRGFFEADGTLYWGRSRKIVNIYNNNVELLEFIAKRLKERGYNSVGIYRNRGRTYSLTIQTGDDVLRFLSEIKPVVKNKIMDWMELRRQFARIRPRDEKGRFVPLRDKTLYNLLWAAFIDKALGLL